MLSCPSLLMGDHQGGSALGITRKGITRKGITHKETVHTFDTRVGTPRRQHHATGVTPLAFIEEGHEIAPNHHDGPFCGPAVYLLFLQTGLNCRPDDKLAPALYVVSHRIRITILTRKPRTRRAHLLTHVTSCSCRCVLYTKGTRKTLLPNSPPPCPLGTVHAGRTPKPQ